MSYDLDVPGHELEYWQSLPLSSPAKLRIQEFIAGISDKFRLDPVNRPKPHTPYFKIEYLLLDSNGDRRLHRIDLYIRDDKAEFGVLYIAYMELLQ
ncbi:MAG TPA: hypothetical protein VN688_29490 [Gemmataceae bacterium]|nr:hypothetical protein [Gemmataceae bacterium]